MTGDGEAASAELDDLAVARLGQKLQSGLKVQPIRGTHLVKITYDSSKRELTARIANGVAVLALLQPLPGLPALFLEAFCARHRLSPREQEVIGLLLEGLGTAEMAERLSISEHTVRDHFKRLYRKTGTRSRNELLSVLSTARMEPAAGAVKR